MSRRHWVAAVSLWSLMFWPTVLYLTQGPSLACISPQREQWEACEQWCGPHILLLLHGNRWPQCLVLTLLLQKTTLQRSFFFYIWKFYLSLLYLCFINCTFVWLNSSPLIRNRLLSHSICPYYSFPSFSSSQFLLTFSLIEIHSLSISHYKGTGF